MLSSDIMKPEKYSPEVVNLCTSMGNVPIFDRTRSIFANNSV